LEIQIAEEKYTNIDKFLVLERFFYCTDRTVTILKFQFIELLVKAWVQLIFAKFRRQADPRVPATRFPNNFLGFKCHVFSEERRSARYLFLRVLLGMYQDCRYKGETSLYTESVGRPRGRKKDRPHCMYHCPSCCLP
jgi:hypothetical protein